MSASTSNHHLLGQIDGCLTCVTIIQQLAERPGAKDDGVEALLEASKLILPHQQRKQAALRTALALQKAAA